MQSFPRRATSDDGVASLSLPLQLPSIKPTTAKNKKHTRPKPRRDPTLSFRGRRDSRLYNLTLDVNDLKQEIHNLAVRRQLLHTRALYESQLISDSSAVRTVVHYFQGFAHGYRGPHTHVSQDAFVRSIAGGNFSIGVTGLGVDMLLEQWRRYTELFRLNQTVIHSAELLAQSDAFEDDGESAFMLVKCVISLHGVFTRDAVDKIFPNTQRDPVLLLRVLGQKLVIPIVFHLYFDARGQLVRHDADADFLAAVRGALGGDGNAAVRFVGAMRMGQESMVGPFCEAGDDHETADDLVVEEPINTDRDLGNSVREVDGDGSGSGSGSESQGS